ncbi:MAG TPA: serine/threonine protein kinase [Cyanobacteria bacterium UBA11370]|nr:serine/threonine protein kinase [Cyanobacteria bacterium UBA11370]HBY81829.1 serine/threonine protein kinase [Cyanobacteria bacterium UBA11148]
MSWIPGQQLQNRPYVVESILGSGGFGITYKVRHLELNQCFVIKTANDHLKFDRDYDNYINRFIKEGQRIAALCADPHPHIVRVNDLFQEDNTYCLVMDFIPGESLWKLVQQQGATAEEKAIQYMCQIGEAITVVHQAGLVHRDVTPVNIMMRNQAKAVLIDFGIAKEIIPTTSTTTDKAGNRAFAPYEQVARGSRKVTVDVYSLAASLYYIVTGQCPMDALDRKLFDQELIPPKQLSPRLSDRTNQAIMKGMALEAEDRPHSVQEWLNLLTVPPATPGKINNNLGEKLQAILGFKQIAVKSQIPALQVFKFDVVTVNKKGQETNRRRQQAEYFTENLGKGLILEMVAIPGGKFLMGSPATEEERRDSESPQHPVTVKPFFMGKYPITQSQWQAVAALPQVNRTLEPDPSRFKGNHRPVEKISWYDAIEFCERLSRLTQRAYRLPSEAEWEYACRAGTKTPFHFGETITPDLANYNGNYTYADASKGKYREETTPVGSFQIANAFGLYDMHGNVWEWCEDHWHDNYEVAPSDGSAWLSENDNQLRLLRGGSWYYPPWCCRCADRSWRNAPVSRNCLIGFRVVCAAAWTL